MPEIQDITYRHEAILRWMLCNPDKKLADCARELNYTQAWLSIIIHSDMFQSRLRSMQERFNDETLISLREKLNGIAHASLDKLADNIELSDDPKFLLDVTERTLSRLGYGTQKGTTVNLINNTQNNVVMSPVSPDVLQEARRMRESLQQTIDQEELREFPLEESASAAQILLEGVVTVEEKVTVDLEALFENSDETSK